MWSRILDKLMGRKQRLSMPNLRETERGGRPFEPMHKRRRTAVFTGRVNLIEELMESTYTHPDLQTWLIIYLRNRNKARVQDLEGLSNSMRSIAIEQDRIGWAQFAEGRMTKRIRDMQTMYMCNRGLT